MIVVVCLNAALDVTYTVPELIVGESHRVASTEARAGGKGLNVARVLHQLGTAVVATGFGGGDTGSTIRRALQGAGVEEHLVPIGEESRRCLTVVAQDRATVFNETGPTVTSAEWRLLVERVRELLRRDAAVLVLSGSVPPGVPTDAYAVLTALAKRAGVLVLVDAEGEVLEAALEAGPDVVKPNGREASAVLGRAVRTLDDARDAAIALRARGAAGAVVSLGVDGLVVSSEDGSYIAVPPHLISGNATGAGDALAASLARGLAVGPVDWPALLTDGVAVSGAAVARPVAGEIDLDIAADLRHQVVIRRIP